jgi:cytochrome P450
VPLGPITRLTCRRRRFGPAPPPSGNTFAHLRATCPVSWHRPVENLLIEDPNDQGFWAVMSHAALVEVTKRHVDFLSGEGIVMESLPQELLDFGQGFIALDPPRHTKVRRLLKPRSSPRRPTAAYVGSWYPDPSRHMLSGRHG